MSDVSALARASRNNRNKVTNGTRLHQVDVDGRTAMARRFRDVLAEIVSDLGGSDILSEAQRQLARRVALMSVQCELMEADAITGKDIDLDAFGIMTDRLGRTFKRLGIKRTPRDVTPDLQTYIKSREAAQ